MGTVDLGCADSVRDPAGYFRAARADGGAVQWSDANHAWVLISHVEVDAAFRDSTRLSADRSAVFQRIAARCSPEFHLVADLLAGWMNFRDDPEHQRLREPVRAPFAPRAVAALEPLVRSAVDRAIDEFSGEPVELLGEFAGPIPAMVIAALLGADPAEHRQFQAWSDDLARIVFALRPGALEEGPILEATRSFVAFFTDLIERERRSPSGTVLTAVVNSEVGTLSTLELVGACTMLLFGGHETTASLIDQSLAILLERPDLAAWCNSPARWDTAVDEFMRTVGPARTMARKVAVDHRRGGHELRVGDTVLLSIAAANHDDAVFERPEVLDLGRTPNPHLGFGWGPHFCLGSNLARLEAKVALSTLFERFPGIALAEPLEPLFGATLGFRPRRVHAHLR